MPVVKCPKCGAQYKAKDEQIGKNFKCKCGEIIAVPAAAGEPASPAAESPGDVEAVEKLKAAHDRILNELHKVIVGQDAVIQQLLIAIFSRGHCLLEGVPGLAKTLMVSSLASSLDLAFRRIQFTPDLMPSDITGTEVLQDDPETRRRVFQFMKGPVFSNVILADEINRTPPKTQAALLEAMQERKVSIGGEDHHLEEPFFVLATQNPLEQEGTYPLPEAQLDRFFFKIVVDYPKDEEELEIMRRVSAPGFGTGEHLIEPALGREEIISLQDLVLRVPVADHVFQYAKRLVRSTRPESEEAPDFAREWISWGASPRASIFLVIAGKARAILNGQYHVSCEDVEAVAPPILRHRIACNFAAQAEGITTDEVTRRLLEATPKFEEATA